MTSRLGFLALAALLLLVPLRGADAASPGPSGRIVYVAGGTIRSVAADGSGVVDTGVAGTSPSWSPAADRIAYVDAGGDLAIMDADGSPSAKVPGPIAASEVVWSPDGTTLAFTASNDVWTVPADGGAAPVNLTNSPTVADFGPTWAPEGTRLAFVSHRDGNDEIYAMNADGTAQTRLTASGAADTAPTWSPDLDTIVFESARDGRPQVYRVGAGGGAEERLTNEAHDDAAPTWAPDGTTIAFTRDGQLATMTPDGGSIAAVAGPVAAADPEWGLAFGVTSPPTISPSTGLAAGTTLTASPGSWSGSATPAFGYQWKRCGPSGASCVSIPGATSQTYVLGAADGSTTIRVTVTGTVSGVGSSNATSAQTDLVAATAPSLAKDSAPSVRFTGGAPVEGTAATALTGTWNGTTPLAFTYLWERCDAAGGGCALTGGTGSSYVPTAADIGSTLRVEVTAANGAGSVTAESAPTPRVAGVAPAIVVYPVVSGTPAIGRTLTTTAGTWSGRAPISFRFQWSKCDVVENCYSIAGANGSTFRPTADLSGWTIAIRVTATNSVGSASVLSAHTPSTVALAPPINSVRPAVSGTAAVGDELKVGNGTWTTVVPSGYSYEWRRCGASGALETCVPIAGASSSAYVPGAGDLGSTIRAYVTARSSTGAATAISDATAAVRPRIRLRPTLVVKPRIVGDAEPGHRLRVSAGVWKGEAPLRFSYSWRRCDATGGSCRAVRHATGRSYLVTRADSGYTIVVFVSVRNRVARRTARSAPTDAVRLGPSHRGRRVVGTNASNYLPGGGRDDTVIGRGGNDTLVGGDGDDLLTAGRGNDVVVGGAGRDRLYGGPGSDTVVAADGEKDVVDCGAGKDRALVDAIDVIKGCESTQTIAAPAPPPATTTTGTTTTTTTSTTTTSPTSTTSTDETTTGETTTDETTSDDD